MSPRKLTDSDKQEILRLYRTPQETTSTLAERYQVSSSTISRFLKSNLSEGEYEELIQQKRLSRTPEGAAQVMSQFAQQQDTEEPADEDNGEDGDAEETSSAPRRTRKRSSAKTSPPPVLNAKKSPRIVSVEPETPKVSPPILNTKKSPPVASVEPEADFFEVDEEEEEATVHALEEMLGEDLGDLDEGDDLEDFEEEDEDWEEEDEGDISEVRRLASANIQVLPLSQATLPRTCYLVVDRAAELITRPLKEFDDLGQIPADELQQRTLPVFDNHRVARRFSNRSQRVIKVPDSRMLEKTGTYLEAKGITRLLIDGQVYALSLSL
ncbi:transposase [Lusitaniella coriacea LEGE 07157]|uniref:Transposase n=1 Tax=Lusitaniella coriacea LEGE 07157 TaxID=945747 RepID=A0A8J7E3R4_9CYAN|nr:transposase [Lusitaniella coriacea]MBE9118124.1 transposase [Lusitaniella coriacea LEGE 07157]